MKCLNLKMSGLIIPALGLILFFQNCSKVQMTPIDLSSEMNVALPPAGAGNETFGDDDAIPDPIVSGDDDTELGLKGGHFDLDTSVLVYAFNQGKTAHHEHEYDDKFDVKEVDFFNLLQKDFTEITGQVSPTQEFIIVVANAALSPGALLEINGVAVSVVDYQKKVDAYLAGDLLALKAYNLASLKDFKLKFASESLLDNTLVATATGCVRSNKPSARGEYRNGALVVQLLDKNLAKISQTYRAAEIAGGLLWEASIFWHKDSTCQ